MKKFNVSRAIASVLAVSLVLGAPGAQAWGQVAASVRPASVGAGAGTAGAITPASGSFAIPALSLSGPSLSLSAPALSAPMLAPAPSAISAAAVPSALAVARVSAAVPSAPDLSKPTALTSSLSAASARMVPVSGKTPENVFEKISFFFDGLVARRPSVDAVSAVGDGAPKDAARDSALGSPRVMLIPVLVTLSDPNSVETLGETIVNMNKDLGFRLDDAYGAVQAPGVVTVRGAIPLENLNALSSAPGVVSVVPTTGRMAFASVPAAPSAQAPARENLLRAGLRGLILKSPVLGSVAVLPLLFATAVAFMGPVTGALALGGAAAVLKPWMLGTAVGMAASYSFLAPLFAWIPLKLRVGATYGMASVLAFTFYGLVPGLPALWIAANLLLSLLATRGSFASLAASGNGPVDKTVNSTEASAFLNILGYQATVPILILAGMLPLAFGILAVSTILSLLLLIKARAKAVIPAPSAKPPSAPEGLNLTNLQFRAAAPKRPAHKPFIPATRIIADMEKLLKTDPDAALKAAAAAIVDVNERRSEVKIGAQRILASFPIGRTLPHYLELLNLTARTGLQLSKDTGTDPWWYSQRAALIRISREAGALKPGTPELLEALKTTYKDRNASVRLTAAGALTALGVDPGPEVSYDVVPSEPEPAATPASPAAAPKAAKSSGLLKWLPILLIVGVYGWMSLNRAPAPAPAAPTTIEQTTSAPATPALKADPKDAALEQIAKDTKRTADAAERSAKAAEEMAKPKGSFLSTLLWTLGPIVLMVFLMRKFLGGMAGGGMAGGGLAGKLKSTPTMSLVKQKTRFADVAGIDETLVEIQEIMDFLRNPSRFKKLGARMPKGILMEGPPGTGKTLLAQALAGETDATFISITGSDFVELWVGNGARKVRELFEFARANAPSIIFIDEIDAVGKKRSDGGPGGGGHDEREQTLNQILSEMQGFDNSSGVIVLAATNRAETLDPALTRPGRFDRTIHVGRPEAIGREAILALHAKKVPLSAEVDLRLIARRTAGLTGAYLENVINEAAFLAARRDANAVNAADMDEAVDRATIGGKRTLKMSEELKLSIARHEGGHVAGNQLNENPELRVPVNKVTIIPHGSGALGFAETGSEDGDKYSMTRRELEARLDTALGGLVAEKIYYGEWSTGPGSDLEAATNVARSMVQQLGMSEEMGLAHTAPNQYGQSKFGGEVDARALVEINKLLKASMERVENRLSRNKDKLDALVAAMMEKETLLSDEIEAILHPKPKP